MKHTKEKPAVLDPLKAEHVHPKPAQAAPVVQPEAQASEQTNPTPKSTADENSQ